MGLAAVCALTVGVSGVSGVAAAGPTTPRPARVCANTESASATYTVAAGDSWFAIALAAGTTPGTLLAANDAAVSTGLHPGDVLCIPAGATPPSVSAAAACEIRRQVVAGDSWFGLARDAGVTLADLLAANTATAATVLKVGDNVCLPPGAAPSAASPRCADSHTVAAGDSWYEIARVSGVGVAELLGANNASASTVLRPGDEICLPAGATPADTANPCVSKITVVTGDSWYAISRASGAPLAPLYLANDASSATMLNPGDTICVPAVGFGRGRLRRAIEVSPVRAACRFANSWGAPRSGSRRHSGVDLIAPAGAPVVAVSDGTLSRQTQDQPGSRSGNAWWLTTPDGTSFFYAHLAAFAPGLEVGSNVRAGDVIGYVGATGNAVSAHLHFEIHRAGAAVNPYEAIWMDGGCVLDRRYEQAAHW